MKDKSLLGVLFVVAIIATLGLSTLYTAVIAPALAPPLTLEERYLAAIKDAMIAEPDEVSTNLTPITLNNSDLVWQGEDENANVLVVIWTSYASSYPVGENINTWWGYTWVTVAPEIQEYFSTHDSNEDYTIRVAQLLGLPANTTNAYFVEVWVNPQDLFRPTPDKEITDTTAMLTFPADVTDTHKEWFNSNIISSYYPMAYPWTRLGYTYNWDNSASHVGLSEYIITQNATVTVESVTSTSEYLQNP